MGRVRTHGAKARAITIAGSVLALAVAGSVGALTLVSNSGQKNEPGAPSITADSNPAESSNDPAPLTIPDSDYAYPSDAIFVAPTGNDAGAGTITDPFATVAHAVAVAPSGGTVVLRAGVYRETLGSLSKPLTLQPYPHEQAWLSGSVVVTGWSPVWNAWAHTGWTTQFCQTCFDSRAITSAYPAAGLPDMVFIDGRPLSQVTSLAAVGPGKFFVDYNAQTLYVGDDPTGPGTVVESAAQSQAVMLQPKAAGTVVRGIGFEEYAPQWNPWPNPAMVTVNNAPNVVFERDAFVRSASRGLTIYATGATVTDSDFVDNGMLGLHANLADHLDIERNLVARNNTEHFATSNAVASSAGIKVTSTGFLTVAHNVLEDNYASGMWCDLSCHDAQIVDNLARRNDQNGIYVEVSGLTLVASNVSVQNGGDGLKLSGTTDTRVYNNTLADNAGHALGVYDDGRRNTDPTTVAMGITWQPARNTIYNNVFESSATAGVNPLLVTVDNDRPIVDDASTMITGLDSDVYARATSSAPATLVTWIHPGPTPAGAFATLGALQSATGKEPSGLEFTGPGAPALFNDPAHGDYTLDPSSPAAGSGAALPADVAAAIGAPSGAVDRGALVAPSGAPSATTTTITAAATQLPAPETIAIAVTNAAPIALAPSGAVTLVDTTSGTAIGSVLLDGTGQAFLTTTGLNAGAHDLAVDYGGDRDNLPSSTTATVSIAAASTTTTIASDVAQSVFGQPVTLTAHVDSGVAPTGTVTFGDGTQPIGTAPVDGSGDAALVVRDLGVGSHTINATYSGDVNAAPSSDANDASVVVGPASVQPSLSASPPNPQVGDTVTLTASVGAVQPGSGVPTGTVTFFDGTTSLGSATLDATGAASIDIASLGLGTHSLTVSYTGDGDFLAGTSSVVALGVAATRTTTTLTPSTAAAVTGQTVTLTANVTDANGAVTDGSIAFTDSVGGQTLGVAALDANGDASVSVATLALGTHTITATFGGNAEGDGGSSAPTGVTVSPAPVAVNATVSPTSVTVGGSVHVHATVSVAAPGSGTPAGVVRVTDTATSTQLADLTLDANGTVDGDVDAGALGGHTLDFAYQGSDTYASGDGTASYGVVPASTATAASVDLTDPAFGQTVTLRAVVTGGTVTPTGTVTFSDLGAVLGQAPLDGTGTATFPTSALVAGVHEIVATYSGDANDTASDSSTAPLTVTVEPALTTTAVTADVTNPAHGQLVTLTVHVTGANPTGNVTLVDGGVPVGSPLPLDTDGTARTTSATLAVGVHTITAIYSGDANHAPGDSSGAPLSLTVAKAPTSTALVASAASSTVGAPVRLTATVAVDAPGQGVPTGTVTFADGASAIGAPVALDGSGQAAIVVATLPVGVQGLTAAYHGDTNSATSASSPVTVTVNGRPTTVTVVSSRPTSVSGQPVTFRATVTDAKGAVTNGAVAFADATVTPAVALATVPLDAQGHAAFTTTALPVGSRAITATYLGGANDAPGGPSSVTQTVNRAASTTALNATPATAGAGMPVALSATVSVPSPGQGTPTGTVTFLDGSHAIGSAVALGAGSNATLTTTKLATGTHTIAAVYSGDAATAPSTSTVVTVTITPRPTTVASASPSATSVYGQAVALSVNVVDPLGAVTRGMVVFRDMIAGVTTTLGTVAVDPSGNAQVSVTFRKVGTHTISARYLGSGVDSPSSPSTFVQTVLRASAAVGAHVTPLTVAPGVAISVAVTATAVAPATGTPGGTFTVYDGTTQVATGTLGTAGTKTVSCTPLATVGTHPITVATAGNAAFAPARSTAVNVTVKKK